MNALLWTLQLLLSAAFLAHGWLFLAPPPDIAALMNASIPRWFQLFLGVAEVMAAAGLTLPGMTRILPWLVSWAAGGIMVVMVSSRRARRARSSLLRASLPLIRAFITKASKGTKVHATLNRHSHGATETPRHRESPSFITKVACFHHEGLEGREVLS